MNYQPYSVYPGIMDTRYSNQLPTNYQPIKQNMVSNQNDERFGFLGPFSLGGITGGLLAPAFNQPRPYYYNNYYYPPYYYYRPY